MPLEIVEYRASDFGSGAGAGTIDRGRGACVGTAIGKGQGAREPKGYVYTLPPTYHTP